MAAEPAAAETGTGAGHRFLISLGLMVLAEGCLLAARGVFAARGNGAPAIDTLIWLWPLCWVTIIAICLTLASWGRLVASPTKGVVGKRQLAMVMGLRLLISSGLLMVPLVATAYAIIMLVLAMASAAATT